jgi:hypothetical protein
MVQHVAQATDSIWRRPEGSILRRKVTRDDTIYPGDVIGSGTVGTGCGLELDRWVQPGAVIELEIEKIGVLRNRVVKPNDTEPRP